MLPCGFLRSLYNKRRLMMLKIFLFLLSVFPLPCLLPRSLASRPYFPWRAWGHLVRSGRTRLHHSDRWAPASLCMETSLCWIKQLTRTFIAFCFHSHIFHFASICHMFDLSQTQPAGCRDAYLLHMWSSRLLGRWETQPAGCKNAYLLHMWSMSRDTACRLSSYWVLW